MSDLDLPSPPAANATDYPAAEPEDATDGTLDLRIIGIFVILAAAMLGSLPPLFIKASQIVVLEEACLSPLLDGLI